MTLSSFASILTPWLLVIGTATGLVAAGLFIQWAVYAIAGRVAHRTPYAIDELLVEHTRAPSRVLVPLFLLAFSWPSLKLPEVAAGFSQRLLSIAFIGAGAWFFIGVLSALAGSIALRHRLDVEDNLRARQILTQTRVLKRSATIVVLVVAGALILLKIPGVENVGASLLASAGLAGIVVGLAARPTVTNLLAGVQLALTQPIRIDDVVIVEGEWGRIEEIRSTYVVVRIWDLRRLVVPLSHFIEQPFQNWTRVTAELLGTVFVHVDYATPIDEVRAELKRILDASGKWDGKAWNLQVTDAGAQTVQLRAMMSAPDAGTAWDLRCHVREQLIAYLQRKHPTALPRARAEIHAPPGSLPALATPRDDAPG